VTIEVDGAGVGNDLIGVDCDFVRTGRGCAMDAVMGSIDSAVRLFCVVGGVNSPHMPYSCLSYNLPAVKLINSGEAWREVSYIVLVPVIFNLSEIIVAYGKNIEKNHTTI
jgi:hypothetical protein